MIYDRTGIILLTEKYTECVTFYGETLELPIMFTAENLTCFELGGAYLMVESGGKAEPNGKTAEQNPVTLRFNVTDLEQTIKQLEGKGVKAQKEVFAWGVIANFYDPDGNVCQLKDRKTFEAQLRNA